MEEEVSNYVQDRHRFVVDILLNVVLLEEELEILSRQIGAFELSQRQRQEGIASTESAADGEGAHFYEYLLHLELKPQSFRFYFLLNGPPLNPHFFTLIMLTLHFNFSNQMGKLHRTQSRMPHLLATRR